MDVQDAIPLLHSEETPSHESRRRRPPARATRLGRMRRYLMMVFVAAGITIMLLYSRQLAEQLVVRKGDQEIRTYTTETPAFGNIGYDVPMNPRPSWVQWTWVCRNYTCERMQYSESELLQSLATCNMFCGSTQLWPQPTGPISLSSTMVPVTVDRFKLKIDKSPSKAVAEHLKDAFTLFKDDLRKLELGTQNADLKYLNTGKVSYAVNVRITVKDDGDPRLRLNTNEAYKLIVKPGNTTLVASITANSFCGARNGLETLSQMVWLEPYAASLLAFKEASVEDSPKFKYRGLLLDTARNFFPVKDIIRTIDAMGACKLNTFHWHATDSQSFPLRLNSAPQLAQHGAYGPGAIYTREDVKAVVRRARLRGIRVVIEVDAPAHVGSAFSWGPSDGLGDLAYCVEQQPWKAYCGEPPCGQLNPQNSRVYDLLEKIYAEIIELTGVDDVFHLGGDEVNARCWNTNIKETNEMDLWLDFTQKSMQALERANGGKAPELTMLWSSHLTQKSYLNSLKQFAIQLWGASNWPDQRAVLDGGFRSILSHVNAWYLDCGFGSWRDDSYGHCPPYRQWQLVYSHRPWMVDPSRTWRIEGGAVCLWTETLSSYGLDSRLWPRAAALAERLWSDPDNKVTADVYLRLDTQRSRLMARGVGVDPLWPRWCTQNPNACLD